MKILKQITIRLSVKTGVDLSTANVSASALGLGLNVGTNGVSVDTPMGSFNLKFQSSNLMLFLWKRLYWMLVQ